MTVTKIGRFLVDWEEHTMDPQDHSNEKIDFWWGDMRPKEIIRLIRETYERGYEAGCRERGDGNVA